MGGSQASIPMRTIMRCSDRTIEAANNRAVRLSNAVAAEKLDHVHTASGIVKWCGILGNTWAAKKKYTTY
jgi:hypothetical protein